MTNVHYKNIGYTIDQVHYTTIGYTIDQVWVIGFKGKVAK